MLSMFPPFSPKPSSFSTPYSNKVLLQTVVISVPGRNALARLLPYLVEAFPESTQLMASKWEIGNSCLRLMSTSIPPTYFAAFLCQNRYAYITTLGVYSGLYFTARERERETLSDEESSKGAISETPSPYNKSIINPAQPPSTHMNQLL